MLNYQLNDSVILKKQHPCGSFEWIITRVGADIKIKCAICERSVMLSREELNKKIKKVVNK